MRFLSLQLPSCFHRLTRGCKPKIFRKAGAGATSHRHPTPSPLRSGREDRGENSPNTGSRFEPLNLRSNRRVRRAALKTRAVQTLRAVPWRSIVAKRLDCVRFIAAWGTGVHAKEALIKNLSSSAQKPLASPFAAGEISPKPIAHCPRTGARHLCRFRAALPTHVEAA